MSDTPPVWAGLSLGGWAGGGYEVAVAVFMKGQMTRVHALSYRSA